MPESAPIPILNLRGIPVLIDTDLARLYGVQTRALNQAVRRNADRFPGDFLFQLSESEKSEVITKCDHRKTPAPAATSAGQTPPTHRLRKPGGQMTSAQE